MKTCFKCDEEKPLSEFYKHSGMADGHLGKCKECTKRENRENREKRIEQYTEYEQKRARTPKRRKARVESLRRRDPIKRRATYLTSNAIRDGRLVRQPCEVCGAEKVEAHHDDYSKPMEVRWLCRKHHLDIHGKKMRVSR